MGSSSYNSIRADGCSRHTAGKRDRNLVYLFILEGKEGAGVEPTSHVTQVLHPSFGVCVCVPGQGAGMRSSRSFCIFPSAINMHIRTVWSFTCTLQQDGAQRHLYRFPRPAHRAQLTGVSVQMAVTTSQSSH